MRTRRFEGRALCARRRARRSEVAEAAAATRRRSVITSRGARGRLRRNVHRNVNSDQTMTATAKMMNI
jgi:hypothetical protein